MQGIGEHEPGTLVAREVGHGAQVVQVADAPAVRGAGGVELHRPPPHAALGSHACAGADDQPPRRAVAGMKRVVAQREIVARTGTAAVLELDVAVSCGPGALLDDQRRGAREVLGRYADNLAERRDGVRVAAGRSLLGIDVLGLDTPRVRHGSSLPGPRIRRRGAGLLSTTSDVRGSRGKRR